MPKIYRSAIIEAPVGRVWDFIRDFNVLPRWFPTVVKSQIEAGMASDQIGCIRSLEVEGGGHVRERLLGLSDRDHTCTYTVVEGLPLSNYDATIRLFQVTDGDRTFFHWTADFDCAADKEAELVALLTGLFEGAFGNLKRHFSQ